MDNKRKNNKRNNKTNTRKKIKNKSKMGFKKVVTIDLLLIVAILAMFIFVKCRKLQVSIFGWHMVQGGFGSDVCDENE